MGHFLSSCSKYAFTDADEPLRKKAIEIVDIMAQCGKPNGYLSAFEEEVLDTLEFEENRNVWAPYYTLHKIIQGLVDCYLYLHNDKALALALNLAHYIFHRFEKLSFWKIDSILRCTKVNPVNEFGGIGDVLYTLYEISNDEKILEVAKIFDRDYFIENLASNKDVLNNLHANTHLPMVLSSMHRYNITGEEKYKAAAINFYHYLLGTTFANGNSSSTPIDLKPECGYIIIDRIFHDMDKIEIKIDACLHLVRLKRSDMVAIKFGKILLAQIGESQILSDISNENINTKLILQKENNKLKFVPDDPDSKSKFIPLFRIEDETYTVYRDFTGKPQTNREFTYAKDGSSVYHSIP